MKLFTLVTIATLMTMMAQAQTTSTTSAASQDQTVAPATQSSTVLAAPSHSAPSNILLGYKSYNDSARLGNTDVVGAKTYQSKNEVFAGYRADNGWGGYVQATQYYRTFFNDESRNKWYQSDTSLSLLHPDFYKSDNLTISGVFRYYTRTTANTQRKETDLTSYYFRVNAKLAPNQDIFNEIIPRYFDTKNHVATDTSFYVEDTTIYNYKLDGSKWKIGTKSWAQVENHYGTGTGYCLEAGPQTTYSFNSNFTISPSISLPILKSNSVYDGPKAVGTDQAYLSLFLQAKL